MFAVSALRRAVWNASRLNVRSYSAAAAAIPEPNRTPELPPTKVSSDVVFHRHQIRSNLQHVAPFLFQPVLRALRFWS